MSYDELCKKVLEIDPKVRFTGVLDNYGKLVSNFYKEGVEKLLSSDEIKMSTHYTLQRTLKAQNLAHKIGNERSSITEYDKVTLISIPLNPKELFLMSTDPDANYYEIINKANSLIKN